MNHLSKKVDQNQHRRMKNGDYLFVTAPNLVNRKRLHGLSVGSEMKSIKWIFGEMKDIEIFEVFSKYTKTKKINIEVLKEEHEYWKVVDKIYTDENNLFMIFCTENKFPAIDLYCTENLEDLREDIKKYLYTQK